jgi:hypothetical protein
MLNSRRSVRPRLPKKEADLAARRGKEICSIALCPTFISSFGQEADALGLTAIT